jgi:DNA-binding MarR family transcriptional regulator
MPARGHVNFALQTFRINQLVGKAMNDALAPAGLGSGDFAILSVLRLVQPIRSTELAEILRMPPTSLSTRLAVLQRRRLVRRHRDESDGRARLVELTKLGERKVLACFEPFRSFITTVEGRLGERLGGVQDALAELERALDTSGRDERRLEEIAARAS